MCAAVQKASIRLDLEGDLLEMFETIKKDRCLESNAETIRLLISDEYKRIRKEVA